VMHDLVVPFALARLQIDAHETVAEEVVAGTVAAVEIRRRILDGQIHEAKLFIDGDLRPHAGVAVDGPRFLLPRVVSEFTGTRNRVERPEQPAAADVPRAHEAL